MNLQNEGEIERDEMNVHREMTDKIRTMMDGRHPDGHRFFLHASTLAIDDLNVNISVKSEIPHWWDDILSEL